MEAWQNQTISYDECIQDSSDSFWTLFRELTISRWSARFLCTTNAICTLRWKADRRHWPSCTWAERGKHKPGRGIAISSCSRIRISAWPGRTPWASSSRFWLNCNQRTKHHSGSSLIRPNMPQNHDPPPGRPRAPLRANPRLLPVTAKQEPERATRRRTRHGVERWAQARTRSRSSVFTPSATKMQETLNKIPAASVYLLEKAHLLPFFVAFSRRDESIILKGWGDVYLINLQWCQRSERICIHF